MVSGGEVCARSFAPVTIDTSTCYGTLEIAAAAGALTRSSIRMRGAFFLTEFSAGVDNRPTEVPMRWRVVLLLAFWTLLCNADPPRLAADTPPPSISVHGVITPIAVGDTNCPVATNALYECGGVPPSAYLVFDKGKAHAKSCRYSRIIGYEDLNACPGYRLIHVQRVAKPLVPPPPCAPVECTP